MKLFSESLPFVFWSAALFYVSCLAVLVVPSLRKWVVRTFSIPRPSTNDYIGSLDGIRGLAALWIASFHTWQWHSFNKGMDDGWAELLVGNGNKAVPVFVILSAFLIYRSLRNKTLNQSVLKKYSKRRILRIYPLYVATVFVAVFFGFMNPNPNVVQELLRFLSMSRVFMYTSNFNAPAWSLYVEVAFYIILPLWLLFTQKKILKYSIIGFFVFAIANTDPPREFSLVKFFFLGVIACEVFYSKWFQKIGQEVATALVVFSLGALYIDLKYGAETDLIAQFLANTLAHIGIVLSFEKSYATILLGIGAVSFLLGALKAKWLSKVLGLYPFRFAGVVSYSVFMWHSFVITTNTNLTITGHVVDRGRTFPAAFQNGSLELLLIYFPSILMVASVSYLCLERPFQKYR